MSDHVYLGKFWPSPKTPARIIVEMTIKAIDGSGGNRWDYWASVKDCNGGERGVGGELVAESKQDADLKAMYKLVGLLAEMLADTVQERA